MKQLLMKIKMRQVFILFFIAMVLTLSSCINSQNVVTTQATATEQVTTISQSNGTTQSEITQEDNTNNDNEPLDAPVFSLASANRTVPPDIITEISFFGGGGGGFDCKDGPEFRVYPDTVELNQKVTITICNWMPSSDPIIILTDPLGNTRELLGRSVKENTMWGTPAYVTTVFFVDLNASTSVYVVSVTKDNQYLETAFMVVRPSGPRLYWYLDDSKIILYNFSPNETVRLLAYESYKYYASEDHKDLFNIPDLDELGELIHDFKVREGGDLSGWQTYQVDSQGKLTIHLDSQASLIWETVKGMNYGFGYGAIGDISGTAETYQILRSQSPPYDLFSVPIMEEYYNLSP